MTSADAYLAHIKTVITLCPSITQWETLREEAQGDIGMLRYRLTLTNSDLLEVFEFFRIVDEVVIRPKYSYHWQSADGVLHARWDNAAHHPEIVTHPHHIHRQSEIDVLPSEAITLSEVLAIVTGTDQL
jgi:hypothetical protein